MRPANIITAISDILAGVAISGYLMDDSFDVVPVMLLIMATAGLYGGGVVMNDFFDADLDQRERPERPIPSGLISKDEALTLGLVLLMIGIVAGLLMYWFNGQLISCMIALIIAIAALTYDKWGKHHPVWGPLNMGACRGLNLLLGISVIPGALQEYGFVAVVPVIYIAAITMVSRGEVHGSSKVTLLTAGFLYVVVMGCILYVSIVEGTAINTIIFIMVWGTLIFPPLKKALAHPSGKQIGGAVKAGVIALIAMNAAWAAALSTVYFALVIILLLPLSILLARMFAVT